jgi:hypothetical protein
VLLTCHLEAQIVSEVTSNAVTVAGGVIVFIWWFEHSMLDVLLTHTLMDQIARVVIQLSSPPPLPMLTLILGWSMMRTDRGTSARRCSRIQQRHLRQGQAQRKSTLSSLQRQPGLRETRHWAGVGAALHCCLYQEPPANG